MRRLRLLAALAVFLLMVTSAPARSEPRTIVITDELQLGLAEAFMAEGEYYRAITEYKKFLYFFPDSERADYARLQIGMAYYHGGECPPAIESFARVRQHYPSENYAAAAFYEGVCRGRLKDPGAAADNFERVVAVDPPAAEASAALAGLALTALDRQDWAGARRALQRLANDPGNPRAEASKEVLALLDQAETRPRKSAVTAGVLSALVPGSGHAYAGRYRDGVMAFLVNGLFIAGTAVAIDHENYPAAALIGGVGLPFYFGNIYGAADAANKWNLSIARDLRNEMALRLDFYY